MSKPKDVRIVVPEDIARELESIPDRVGCRRSPWTERQDQLLLAGWPKKNQALLAKRIGYHVNTCRKRWLELTGEE